MNVVLLALASNTDKICAYYYERVPFAHPSPVKNG